MENQNQLVTTQRSNSDLAQTRQLRPLLAVLSEDNVKLNKIPNNEEKDALINYLLVILNIKVSNKDEADDLKIQMLVVSEFLTSKFGFLTIPEIKEAFKMFVAREFPEIKVFRILDCVSIGEVLNAYVNYRNESLRIYSQKKQLLLETPKPKTDMEKQEIRLKFIEMLYDDFKKDKFSESAWILYDDLYNSGKIKISDEEKKEIYNQQLLEYSIQQRNEISKKSTIISKALLGELNNKIKNGNSIKVVVNKSKSVIVAKYLNKHMYDFDEFKNSIL